LECITLALIAHDAKKEDMVRLAKMHAENMVRLDLIATRSTGQLIQGRTGLPVTLMQSGSLGGDQQIGALIASGDVSAVMRVCDVHDVPLATNVATAEALLHRIFEQPDAFRVTKRQSIYEMMTSSV
jgi:methylglyoxal synthase